jgi:predicted transcriptional regulator
MKPFCEVVVTSILPAIRSLITRELLTTYKLTQKETAELLGLTQPAISQYNRESRGYKVKLLEKQPKIVEMIDELTKKINSGKLNPRELQTQFCRVCKTIRKNRIICSLHEEIYPSIAPCSECSGEC